MIECENKHVMNLLRKLCEIIDERNIGNGSIESKMEIQPIGKCNGNAVNSLENLTVMILKKCRSLIQNPSDLYVLNVSKAYLEKFNK